MNKDIFQGQLKELSGEIKKKWGQLTDNELLETKGNAESLSGLIQKKFGISKQEATKQVGELMTNFEKKYSSKLGHKIDNLKDRASH